MISISPGFARASSQAKFINKSVNKVADNRLATKNNFATLQLLSSANVESFGEDSNAAKKLLEIEARYMEATGSNKGFQIEIHEEGTGEMPHNYGSLSALVKLCAADTEAHASGNLENLNFQGEEEAAVEGFFRALNNLNPLPDRPVKLTFKAGELRRENIKEAKTSRFAFLGDWLSQGSKWLGDTTTELKRRWSGTDEIDEFLDESVTPSIKRLLALEEVQIGFDSTFGVMIDDPRYDRVTYASLRDAVRASMDEETAPELQEILSELVAELERIGNVIKKRPTRQSPVMIRYDNGKVDISVNGTSIYMEDSSSQRLRNQLGESSSD